MSQDSAEKPVGESTVGILVVHGVGAQDRGDTIRKFGAGLQRIAPDLDLEAVESGETVIIGRQRVRCYEVYWADILKGDRTRGSFVLEEFTSLSWFPWFNYWRGSYGNRKYPVFTLVRNFIFLPLLGALFFLGYWGARTISLLWGRFGEFPKRRSKHDSTMSFWQRVKANGERTANMYSAFDRMLDEFAGDVLTYVNSRSGTFYREASDAAPTEAMKAAANDIMARFDETMGRARADGCQRIQIVAHSLGSVIAYHYLADGRDAPEGHGEAESVDQVEHIYTIGSPLEKFVFLWPNIMPAADRVQARTLAWDNFVSYFDPLAGRLRQFDHWCSVTNHSLLGGGFISAHVIYERSREFLECIVRGVSGDALSLRRTLRERFVDGVMLLGETLATPIMLAAVLLAGLALLTVTALLVPFLASLTVRWWLDPTVWMPYYDWAGILFGSMFAFIFSITPILRATDAHKAQSGNE